MRDRAAYAIVFITSNAITCTPNRLLLLLRQNKKGKLSTQAFALQETCGDVTRICAALMRNSENKENLVGQF